MLIAVLRRCRLVLPLLLLGLVALPALPASAAPPAVSGITVGTPTIDVTDDGVGPISLSATYTGAAISYGYFTVSPPAGSTSGYPRYVNVTSFGSGSVTAAEDWFHYSGDPVGAWRVTGLYVQNAEGEGTEFTNPDTSDTVTVVDDTDRTPPTVDVASFTAAPTAVTTTSSSASVAVSVAVADPSGVQYVDVTATSPTGDVQRAYLRPAPGGTQADGVWQGDIWFPPQSEGGTWTLSVSAADSNNNQAAVSTEQLAAAQRPSTVDVTTVVDNAAPVLTSLSVGPQQVNRRYGSTATVSLGITDDASGFTYGIVNLQPPSGTAVQAYVSDFDRVSGSATDGLYKATAHLPSTAALGTWTVSSVQLYDAADRERTLTTYPSGSRSSFTVVDAVDTTPPVIGTVSTSPAAVDSSTGTQVVQVRVATSDDSSGVDFVSVRFESPTGRYKYGFSSVPATGDSLSGVFVADVEFDTWSEQGTWRLVDVTAYDSAQLSAWHSPGSTVSVTTTNEDLQPPTVTGLSFSQAAPDAEGRIPVTVTVAVSDSRSGFKHGAVRLRAPSGTSTGSAYGELPYQEEGLMSGSLQALVLLPKGAQPGDWRVEAIDLTDRAGNYSELTTAQLDGAGRQTRVAVAGIADDSAPVLTAITVPTTVSTSTSRSVPVTLSVTDGGTGLAFGSVEARSPSGAQYAHSFDGLTRTGGTSTNGTYSTSLVFPAYPEPGTWLVRVTLDDARGNHADYPGTALPAPATGRISVTGPSDTAAPALTGLTMPTTVNTNAGSRAASIGVGVSDAASGVSSVSVAVASPTGRTTSASSPFQMTAVNSGTVTVPVTIGQWAEDGTWTVVSVRLTDVAGNVTTLAPEQLAATGFPRTFTVDGGNDTTAPAVGSLTLSPATVDTRTTDGTLTVTTGLTDAAAGVSSVVVEVTDPGSTRRYSGYAGSPTTGTAQNGSFVSTVTIPRYSVAGTWRVLRVRVTDRAGNSRTVEAAALPAGATKTFTVQGTADTTPPALGSLAVRTPSVDVTQVGKEVEFVATVTDQLAGFAFGTFRLVSPSGQTAHEVSFSSSYHRRTGTPTSGEYLTSTYLPRHVESGTWQVRDLELTDSLGNTSRPTTTLTVSVTGLAGTPMAPGYAYLTPGNGKVTARWYDVDNRGRVLTGFKVDVRRTSDGAVVASGTAGPTAAALSIGGLANGTSYYATVAATWSGGVGAAASSGPAVPGISPPDAPRSLTATPADSAATLTWQAPADNGGTAVTGYVVEIYDEDCEYYYGDACYYATKHLSASTLSTSFTGLTNGKRYYAYVAAQNAKGVGDYAHLPTPVVPGTTSGGDTTAPTVTARTPAVNATRVVGTSNVTATFSEAVTGVSAATFTLKNTATGAAVGAAVAAGSTANQWVLDPTATLANDTRYTVTLSAAVKDVAGNALTATSWTFTTGPAPTVTARTPAVNATAVDRAGSVTATFSEAVTGVSATSFTLKDAAGAAVAAAVSRVGTTNQWVLDPTPVLAANASYTATLSSAVRDAAGNPLSTATWSFRTYDGPAVTATAPVTDAVGADRAGNVTATFSEAVTGVSATTFTLRNAASGTAVSATVTRVGTSTTWQLDPGATLAPATRYTATLTGGTSAIRNAAGKALVTRTWSFTTHDGPAVTARTPAVGATAVSQTGNVTATFSEAVTGVTTTTFRLTNTATGAAVTAAVRAGTTNQWVLDPGSTLAADTRYTVTLTGGTSAIRNSAGKALQTTSWTFTTGPAPTVTARTPASGATGVSRTGNVAATFSEAVSGVTTTTFVLRAPSGAAVTAAVTRNGTTNQWVLDPATTLAASTTYSVSLVGGTSAIRDAGGNPLAATTWSFTTGA